MEYVPFYIAIFTVGLIGILLSICTYKSGQESTLLSLQSFYETYGPDRLLALFESEPYVEDIEEVTKLG